MKKIILILLALTLLIRVEAQSPNTFKFQAVLRDGSGNLISNTSVDVQIDILQGSSSGTVVYSEAQSVEVNTYGILTLLVGGGTVLTGSFPSVNWSNGNYFVRISLNGSVMGTSQLLSVPYAIYADKAGNGFSGNYNDLTNKPTIFDVSWTTLLGIPSFSPVAFSGSYLDLSNVPMFNGTWTSVSGKPSFSAVSISGSYNDLVNKPILFSGNFNDLFNVPLALDGSWTTLSGKPAFSKVSVSGSYYDLLNTPALFNGNYNDLTNLPALFDGTWASLSGKPSLATVAVSGSYFDLTNLPGLFSGSYTDLTDKPVLFSGAYNDLTNKPDVDWSWNSVPGKPAFSKVALSGNYDDLLNTPVLFNGNYNNLTNKPVLFNGSWNSLTDKPDFAKVATSGNYNDLSDQPTVFNGNYNNLTNLPDLFNGTWNSLTGKPDFAKVATTGSYNDLNNLPVLFNGFYNDLSNLPVLFSGNYNDLTNKPVITNWTWSDITGIPDFATVATSGSYNDLSNLPLLFSGDYNDLTNKPSIINWTWSNITGIPNFATVAFSGSYNDLSNLPVYFNGNYNDLTNLPALFNGAYSALTGVPSFAKVAFTGSYSDLNNLPSLFSGNYNDLSNLPVLFSGNYNDLTNKPVLFNGMWSSVYGKPTFSAVATSGSYNDLINQPTLFNGHWSSLTGTPTTLAGYGITDAVSNTSPAGAITNTEISNWNTAYGWGNPALAGYAVPGNLYTKVNLQTSGQSSVNWGNVTNTPNTVAGYDITDFSFSSPSDGQLIVYNGSTKQWVNWTPDFSTGGNQQLTLTGTTLSISGGNNVSFSGWDTNGSNDVTISGTQTISGNKTFSGTLTTSGTIVADAGFSAGGKIINLKHPVNPQDVVTKAYVDSLRNIYNTMEGEYNTILAALNSTSVTDVDGNVYPIVTIGSQTWMAANLQTTHYSNGDPIATTVPDTLDIDNITNPEFQWPSGGNNNNLALYGRLYTWYAATDSRNVCPAGWHVPDSTEFITLITYAGGVYYAPGDYYSGAGNNLKAVGTQTWVTLSGYSPNAGNNEYGFNWVGNGNRYPSFNATAGATFAYFQQYGSVYSASLNQNGIPCHFNARTQYNAIYPDDASYHPASMGCAVRCLKN